jgi:hypothetical protein
MDHGKVAVFAFIDALILDLLVFFPQLESTSVFSDGAASNLSRNQYNIMTTWSFFATKSQERSC